MPKNEDLVPVKKRRFLSSDYDNIAEQIKKEAKDRKALKARTANEVLWKEVDRQVHMEAMEKVDVNGAKDPDRDWESALELGDLSTASEIKTADAMRLIFPQDRTWYTAHADIEPDRINNRQVAAGNPPLDSTEEGKLQKFANAELRALMSQQHADFGFRDRLELSIKEAQHHGGFVAEVAWEEMQQYAMGGALKSQAAPVWIPHSMWNCYPETNELGVNLIYQGSMIICGTKSFDWVMRQNNFINLNKLKNSTKDQKKQVELIHYFGDITIQRKGDNVFLPNMKITVANKDTVIFAQPLDSTVIIYGRYDRVDVRDPYAMSPLVKQSPNHTIATIIANRFIDNVNLKLDPTIIYDGNDPQLIQMGGPKIIPGRQYPTKGGLQNFQQIDVGDPSWAIQAITFFDDKGKQGTGVSAARTGQTRQADRITATQIEEEAAGSEIREIDFVNKVEKAVKSYLYISHEMNKKNLGKYKFYNPEPGMPDFDTLSKVDLPKDVHFDVVGSKGLLTERRRSRQTTETTAFLLSNPATADIPNLIENARQMYADAGNKNPERLMNIPNEEDKVQKAVQAAIEEAQQIIQQLQEQVKDLGTKLVKSEMELTNSRDQLQLRNERAEGDESALRDQIRLMKATQKMQTDFIENQGKLIDKQAELEEKISELSKMEEIAAAKKEGFDSGSATAERTEPAEQQSGGGTEMNFGDVTQVLEPRALKIVRDEAGDMDLVVPVAIPVEATE